MSVEVENLSRYYGSQKAVNSISFEVKKGEILGFLGPNGAGKSTTMKILTGYLPPDEGTARICGLDVQQNSLESRKKIGYLPENNPLYLDMYVREYLLYVASLYKMDQKKREVEHVIQITGLLPESGKKISQLSKGYRQRVGLAQALIHKPEVLILDEPTTGLDPNQLTEIRSLIRSIGQDRTVILSSHIMQEVQALCDRVLIIDRGSKVADSSVSELLKQSGGNEIFLAEFGNPMESNLFSALRGVLSVEAINNTTFRISAEAGSSIREQVFDLAVAHQNMLLGMKQEESNLELIFKNLTS